MIKEKLSATPGQAMAQRTWTNARLIEDIVRLKNSMLGLSIETRDAFQVFKNLVWEDIKHQKRQREMYQQEHGESLAEVKKQNAKQRAALFREKRKAWNNKIKDAIRGSHECYSCKDTGQKDTAGGLIAWCTCPTGIEKMFSPNWKQTDDKAAWLCTTCKAIFSKRKLHQCNSGKIYYEE